MRLKAWASRCAGWLPRFPRPGQTHRQALRDSEAMKREGASLTGHEGCHLNAGAPEARALQAGLMLYSNKPGAVQMPVHSRFNKQAQNQRFRIEDHGGNPLNLSVYGRPDHIVPHRRISRRCRARFRHGYGICSRSGIRAIRLPGCGTSGCEANG